MKDQLDKIMDSYGFKKVKYPINNIKQKQYSIWYVKNKIPYSSAISKAQLLVICMEFNK